MIAYHREVVLNPELITGKRAKVFETALAYYYSQACETAKEICIDEDYGKRLEARKKPC